MGTQQQLIGSRKRAAHPEFVSSFSLGALRGWRSVAKLLVGEHGTGWRRRLGFREGETPSALGLRYFFHGVGPEVLRNYARC